MTTHVQALHDSKLRKALFWPVQYLQQAALRIYARTAIALHSLSMTHVKKPFACATLLLFCTVTNLYYNEAPQTSTYAMSKVYIIDMCWLNNQMLILIVSVKWYDKIENIIFIEFWVSYSNINFLYKAYFRLIPFVVGAESCTDDPLEVYYVFPHEIPKAPQRRTVYGLPAHSVNMYVLILYSYHYGLSLLIKNLVPQLGTNLSTLRAIRTVFTALLILLVKAFCQKCGLTLLSNQVVIKSAHTDRT